MELIFQTAVNAVILASAYILVSLGFAFLFNMLGILNLAHGAIYMVAGYLAYAFIVGFGMPHWAAMSLATIVVACLGVFLERFCFRPFVGDFNRLTMICVAITVILTTTVNILIGTQQMAIPTFAQGVFRHGFVSVNWDRIITFAVGTVILILTTFFVNRSKWGRQMQAISQNKEGAALQGVNIARISAIACAVGFALAAIAGCLMGTLYNLSPFMGQSTLVKVLMIIILAGVGSFGGIFIVGLILGVLYGVLPVIFPGATSDAIAVTVFMVILLFRPQGFFGHEADMGDAKQVEALPATTEKRRKRRLIAIGCAALVVFLAVFPSMIDSPYLLHILALTFIYIIVSVSLRTIAMSGQFPLAHGAFMGIGAYLSGMGAKWLGISPWLSIPGAAIIAAGIGMLFGYPFSRLRSLYYAMGSLFLGVAITQIIQAGGMWTGGYSGLTGIRPLIMGSRLPYYYFFLALCIASVFALYRFEFSRIGMNLKAIAQSHLVASSVGINEGWYRVLAVGMGSFFVGLAGAAYAHYNLVLSPTSFDLSATLWLVMYALIGGIGSFAGPIIGTAILVLIPEFFRSLKMYSPYISAGILLIVVYFIPGGLASLPGVFRSFRIAQKKNKEIADAPGD
jgi:branched-subunit amino acid ABC-type transport system permease component